MTDFPLNVIGWGLCQPALPFTSQQLYSYHLAIICSDWPFDCRYKPWAPQIATSLSCFTAALLLATIQRAIWRSVFSIKPLIEGRIRRDRDFVQTPSWDFYICHSPSSQVSVFKSSRLTVNALIVETTPLHPPHTPYCQSSSFLYLASRWNQAMRNRTHSPPSSAFCCPEKDIRGGIRPHSGVASSPDSLPSVILGEKKNIWQGAHKPLSPPVAQFSLSPCFPNLVV